MSIKDLEQDIKERWFKDHVTELTQHGDLQVLEWRRPGDICYRCRYVFDGNKVYISGDIGEAVFYLTWKANIHSFKDINIDYFEEKLSAYSGNRRAFSSNKAVETLEEWKKELKECGVEYDEEEMEELINAADNCSRKEEWAYEYVNGTYHDFINDLDCDCWEWVYDIGDEIPARVQAYLIGLKMASEQLKEQEIKQEG